MLQKDDLGRLLEYTEWANRRALRSAATLSLDDYKRDLGSSHGGVRGTLTHTMGAEWIWLERFKGVSPTRGLDESEFADVVALQARWRVIEKHRRSWFEALKDKALAEPIRYRALDGSSYEAPLWQLLQHVANHSTYHRGQVATLLRLLGAKHLPTDLVVFDRKRR
jgi:uncharacterized damage-inducible protein DinB